MQRLGLRGDEPLSPREIQASMDQAGLQGSPEPMGLPPSGGNPHTQMAMNLPEPKGNLTAHQQIQAGQDQAHLLERQEARGENNYGIGKIAVDAVLRRGFGMTPFKDNYEESKYNQEKDWAEKDQLREKDRHQSEANSIRLMQTTIGRVADPNSPNYGDASIFQEMMDDPYIRSISGIRGEPTIKDTGEVDPQSGLPIFHLTDTDPVTGQANFDGPVTAEQLTNNLMGALSPEWQQKLGESFAESNTRRTHVQRVAQDVMDHKFEPWLREKLGGMPETPAEQFMATLEFLTGEVGSDKRFEQVGITKKDVISNLTGIDMEPFRVVSSSPVPTEDGGIGFLVQDKNGNLRVEKVRGNISFADTLRGSSKSPSEYEKMATGVIGRALDRAWEETDPEDRESVTQFKKTEQLLRGLLLQISEATGEDWRIHRPAPGGDTPAPKVPPPRDPKDPPVDSPPPKAPGLGDIDGPSSSRYAEVQKSAQEYRKQQGELKKKIESYTSRGLSYIDPNTGNIHSPQGVLKKPQKDSETQRMSGPQRQAAGTMMVRRSKEEHEALEKAIQAILRQVEEQKLTEDQARQRLKELSPYL